MQPVARPQKQKIFHIGLLLPFGYVMGTVGFGVAVAAGGYLFIPGVARRDFLVGSVVVGLGLGMIGCGMFFLYSYFTGLSPQMKKVLAELREDIQSKTEKE